MDDIKNLTAEAQMRVGARLEKFLSILLENREELKNWQPQNENEAELKRAKEDLINSIAEDFCIIFDNILA